MTDYSGRAKTTDPLYMEEIPLEQASEFVLQNHYSKVMPKQNKIVLGAFSGQGGSLVGVITFGWGVRPKDTIRRLFPSLGVANYLEIGKMCMLDSQPKNSESRMLAASMGIIKKTRPEVKLIFTWADALWGKPGYVYQAANFYYGGFIWTDVYMDREGRRFHPRQLPAKLAAEGLSKKDIRQDWKANNGIGCCRPSKAQLAERGWKHVFGMQFRYAYFLCSDKERDDLIADSANARTIKYLATRSKRHLVDGKWTTEKAVHEMTPKKPSIIWKRPASKNEKIYPKKEDMQWKIDDGQEKNGEHSKPVLCDRPQFGEAFDPNRI